MKVLKYIFFIFCLSLHTRLQAANLFIINKNDFKGNPIISLSISDCENLVKQIPSNDSIYLKIQLNESIPLDAFEISYTNKHYQISGYGAKSISDALYEFLERYIGFKFYHPREIFIPKSIILNNKQTLYAKPIFEYRGFHLHTMHPIELTEDLLDPSRPHALENVKEYIDWLARTGQNYFEFNLLESIDRDAWIRHARKIVSYAHERGIYCGIDISLNMLQQKAFQLYETFPFDDEKATKQLIRNTDYLLQAGFDVWNVELSSTEFTSGNQAKKRELLQLLSDKLKQNNVKLMSRNHVVKPEQMVNAGDGKEAADLLNPEHGLMVHTVMFYSLIDQKAPVYRNENLLHMRDILISEKEKRETWYFPESAYWVTFDNSVPMFLTSYFKARLDDIKLCDSLKIPGHLTFSSGWEWGYGLIDYSIAKWSWNFKVDGILEDKTELQYVLPLIQNPNVKSFLQQESAWQEKWIKNNELIRVMVAQTVTDELPGDLNIEFHPRPEYSYPHIRNKANEEELNFIENKYLNGLKTYGFRALYENKNLTKIESEIVDGLNITILRARHKYYTLSYLKNRRLKRKNINVYLDSAARVRTQALTIVKNREASYRYPLADIAEKNKNKTCYSFGYLYTVHKLHFWEREENQARKNKYHFLYKNIWNVGRTIGLID